jgi:PleD family two-component response regulator
LDKKSRLLIVEDDLDLAEMLNAYFRVQNYEVLTAAWGEEAVKMSNENEVDLIVLDIRLPDIDGYEVCRRIREQRTTKLTPIIFLTEKSERSDKLQGLNLGVVDYITKPFDIQELRLRVRNAINRAKRTTVVNPITDLPEAETVDKRIEELLTDENEWAILKIRIAGLKTFRDTYGFVAADDVLRAVTLMIRNAVREYGTPEDFIGHLASNEFAVLTKSASVKPIRERVETRVEQSREYFYPLKDRDKARKAMEAESLKLQVGSVDSTTKPADLAALKKLLAEATPQE